MNELPYVCMRAYACVCFDQGMVVVTGCATKEATSAVELLSIFEAGSKNRHVASTRKDYHSLLYTVYVLYGSLISHVTVYI